MGMLVLTRQKDEVITIGDNIRVMVVDIRPDRVRLGVEAPDEIPVHRLEVYEAIARGSLGHVKAHPIAAGMRSGASSTEESRERKEQAAKQPHDHTEND